MASTTISVELDGGSYLCHPSSSQKLFLPPSSGAGVSSPTPVTVIPLAVNDENDGTSSAARLLEVYHNSLLNDRFSLGFMSRIIFRLDGGATNLKISDLPFYVSSYEIWESDATIQGPYFLLGNQLHRVSRLFHDPFGAFVLGVVQMENDSTSYIPANTEGIPIPPRCYYADPSESHPLMGKRFAAKDIYDIKGLKTGAGSKAFLGFKDPATHTAPSIQRLIDLGAVIIGKVKTTPHASGMTPRDWIDYQCPFNPRGDGYLDTDCSSSGSAAAIAAYPWLDFTVGSDSLGSMVGPATACGLYGIRPTQGLLSNDGAVAVSSILDTPGHFCRNIDLFLNIAQLWIPSIEAPELDLQLHGSPQLITLEDRFETFPIAETRIMHEAINKWELAFGVSRTELDIELLWKSAGPRNCRGVGLSKYLSTTLATIQLYDAYHNSATFRSKYSQKFGRSPAVEPLVRYKWDLGSRISKEQYDTARLEAATFKSFLQYQVLKPNTVLFLPGGFPTVQYRDEYPGDLEASGRPWQGFGFTNTAFSSLGGGPCISIPVGQVPYTSKHTGQEDMKPVSIWVLGAIGSDKWLTKSIAHVLKASGRNGELKVGKTAF